jgi:iron complex transport system permease protein
MTDRPLTPGRYITWVAAWAVVWLVVAAAAVYVGGRLWNFSGLPLENMLALRLEAVATASVVGAALTLAGLALQALLRNPLADPYVLGVSGGASLAVILANFFLSVVWAPAFGFLGALGTIILIYAIAQRRGRLEPYTLLLTGVIVNAFYGAAIMLLTTLVRWEDRGNIAVWMMGDVGSRFGYEDPWPLIITVGVLAVAQAVVFAFFAKGFNLVATGEDTAGALGVRVERLRLLTFVAASLITGASVALAGPIGFVGLIAPHLLRLVFGPDHRRLVPAALFFGATFLVLADLGASVWTEASARSVPVGVVTALCGVPFFIYLLRSRGRRMSM